MRLHISKSTLKIHHAMILCILLSDVLAYLLPAFYSHILLYTVSFLAHTLNSNSLPVSLTATNNFFFPQAAPSHQAIVPEVPFWKDFLHTFSCLHNVGALVLPPQSPTFPLSLGNLLTL